jgi:hypothetical protein
MKMTMVEGIAVDAQDRAYLLGATRSPTSSFPTVPDRSTRVSTSFDMFVSKLDLVTNALVYSTYLGGDGEDQRARQFDGC